MAKYKDATTGEIIEVGSPELNPDLIAGKTKVDDTTPLGIINASTLSPSTPIDYKTTSTPSVPDVSKLDTSVLTLTPQEKKADDLSTQLQDIQNRLLGQSAFRVEKEKELDVEGLRKTQTDLSARLKAIQNEAQAIPLQLQEEAKGRGITVGGLAPEQTGRLRANAIQALSVSSLLEASRGNLTTALDMVDRAVAAKYDPIKEKNSVLLANLELILKSPSYTLADKNRAEVQKAKIAAQTKLDEKKELEEKEIGKIAVDAAKQGVDALTLKKIQEAKTSQEALSLAAPFMSVKEKPTFQTFERVGADGKIHTIRQTLDPMTGKVILETDLGAKTGGAEAPTIKNINGVDMQWNTVSGKWETISGSPTTNALGNAIAEAKIDNINNILTSSAMDSTVGPSGLARTQPGLWAATKRFFAGALVGAGVGAVAGAPFGGVGAIPGALIGAITTGVVNSLRGSKDQLTGDRQNFIGTVVQMTAELTKEKLAQAKGQGVTFGALSDGERGLIANAATKIGSWEIHEDGDREKPVIGYNIDEKSFKAEIDVINYFVKLDAVIKGATPKSVGAVTNPDGSVWIMNSDGTFTQLKQQ